ncbi:hypothetical protein PR202_ga30261 [Eleusine coracana subsp. coracana]|uniref:Uncharacterized protein n=1 Tax=Eleusine coracana subsp. coracana TaxID=191504 RepID=A0AAV5DNG3_ELECO|nr:hypothetical protein PR202_ga30261 [Eleusine coracana subsp. coracana]
MFAQGWRQPEAGVSRGGAARGAGDLRQGRPRVARPGAMTTRWPPRGVNDLTRASRGYDWRSEMGTVEAWAARPGAMEIWVTTRGGTARSGSSGGVGQGRRGLEP